jgi:preprotein translocase subunit SecF
MMGAGSRLYRGEQRIDFIGRRRIGYGVSAALIVIGMVSVLVQGLDFSIEFRGGVVWEVPAGDATVEDVRTELQPFGLEDATIQRVSPAFGGEATGDTVRVTAGAEGTEIEGDVTTALAELTGADRDEVNINTVGPTWGEEISRSALQALVVFFAAIALYISWRFQWKMAAGALAAVLHDIVVTIGIYSLFGFDISPATAIAFLTILGYSLYDTIVVFDKVNEDVNQRTAAGTLTSYADGVNSALNEVLMRSVNTTVTSLLPIASLIVIGSLLGAATLQDFALVLLIGLAVGAYSSIFVAAPVLVALKEREPRYAAMRDRQRARTGPVASSPARVGAAVGAPTPADEPADAGGADREDEVGPPSSGARSIGSSAGPVARGPVTPRGRKKGKRR